MAIELVTKFLPYVDEMFSAESKKSLLTNQDFTWDGAHAVKVYKISTATMNDYGRSGPVEGNWSRYGAVADLDATTETLTLTKDRSFTFAIDKMDENETAGQLAAATALARQQREVIIPEVDAYVYDVMCANAGTKPTALALSKANIYEEILKGSEVLDNALVSETGRCLVVTPATYALLKQAVEFDHTEIGAEMRARGVVAMIDGAAVVKVPAIRLPEKFGFMLCHPSATVAPVKLEDFGIHDDTPLSSGTIVTGRVCYDAFVLDNKKSGIYYQATT